MFKYLLTFIFTVCLFGQDNSDIKLVGHWGESNGDCNVVEAKGDTVFFVEGRGFKVVDYSDKENPVLMGQCILPDKNITAIQIENKYAYILSFSSLMIIDVSNLFKPVYTTKYEINAGNNMVVKDNIAYIGYGYCFEYYCNSGCLILDVSDINSIHEFYNYITNYPVTDIAIKDTTAYLSIQDSIIILNIANPDLPERAAQFGTGASSSSLCISKNFLYSVSTYSGMFVFNIENPYQLNLIYSLDVSGVKARLHGNYLFITQRYDQGPDDLVVAIVDVTSPDAPVKISEINMGDIGFAKSLDYSNNYLYVSHGSSGLYVIDVSDTRHPVEITRYKTGYKNDVVINGNYAYLVSGYEGVQIIDMNNKANPKLIGNIDLKENPGDRTKKAAIEDNILYIMIDRYSDDFVNSIYMFGISDPAKPENLGNFNTNLITDFEVKNKTIYLTGIYDFSIVNAADPKNPVYLNTYSKGSGAGMDLKISGGYAFTGEWLEGLRIIDITDPDNIYEAANYNDFCVGDIYIDKKTVYIIAQSHTDPKYSLRILDIADIPSIKESGAINLYSYAKCIDYKNGKIALGDGLKLIDVSDPSKPEVIDSSAVCGDLNKIIIDDKYIYAADGIDGFYIFEYDGFITSAGHNNPGKYSFKLYQNYPNPFNPVTSISYTIPETGIVQLNIYNVLGEKIAALVNENQHKGNYRIKFDASSLASGIYFYRLQNGTHSDTKKLLLIK